jgi:proteasome lid subunit RPN8/RPN11
MTLIDRLKHWLGHEQPTEEQTGDETHEPSPDTQEPLPDGLPDRAYASPSKGRRKRGIPDSIETYYVPTAVLRQTQQYIEKHGERGHEAYVFWAGGVAGDEAYVMSCVYPTANARHGGVKVPLDKMTEINRELYDRDQLILAQVHSHPGIARHSDVDEEKAVSFHEGFVSIVVPDFGETPVYDLRDCGVYTYTQDEKWRLLDEDEIVDRFVIEDTSIEV